MESDQQQAFNERLSQWISSQGFWFQLRYSMAGGEASSAAYHLLRLAFRVLLFLILLAVLGWVYLSLRVGFTDFSKELSSKVGAELQASELEIRGAKRKNGELVIGRVVSTGGENAFFDSMEVVNLRCKMGVLDGVTGEWDPGLLSIHRLDMGVRAGADDLDTAVRRNETFLKKFPGFDVQNLEALNTTIRWGFSERTAGMIEGSHLTAQRTEGGWRMQFRGGRFSQNWLQKLDIVELVVAADKNGLTIEKGELLAKTGSQTGGGSVSLTGVAITSGERPAVSGVVRLKRVPLDAMIPEMQAFMDGRISGDFALSGSTNSTDGIWAESHVVLEGDDYITLRDRFHLLRALTSIGVLNSYRKVDFREGSFSMKIGGGSVEMREVNLKASEAMTLQGRVKVRPPTDAEIQAAMSSNQVTGEFSPIFATEGQDDDRAIDKTDFSLRRAAEEAAKSEKQKSGKDGGLFARMAQEQADRQNLEKQGAAVFARSLQYEGALRITIPGDSFERSPVVRSLYPADPASGRIVMDVPIAGGLYEITLKQAEELYVKGRRRE